MTIEFDGIWCEKYRPKSIKDVFLPERVKEKLQKIVESGTIPNCIFTSESPGTGKTTSALALCDELQASTLFINASANNSIDDIRTKVISFASTRSFNSKIKVVILDEADRLSAQAQDALKGVIEQFSSVCRFILTANNKQGLTEPLISRCTVDIEFSFEQKEATEIKRAMFAKCVSILNTEIGSDNYDKHIIPVVIKTYFPDNRKTIQVLQELAMNGKITIEDVQSLHGDNVEQLVNWMAERKFAEIKDWTMASHGRFGHGMYRSLLEEVYPRIENNIEKVNTILIINKAQEQYKTVPDKFVHFLALFAEIMVEATIK